MSTQNGLLADIARLEQTLAGEFTRLTASGNLKSALQLIGQVASDLLTLYRLLATTPPPAPVSASTAAPAPTTAPPPIPAVVEPAPEPEPVAAAEPHVPEPHVPEPHVPEPQVTEPVADEGSEVISEIPTATKPRKRT